MSSSLGCSIITLGPVHLPESYREPGANVKASQIDKPMVVWGLGFGNIWGLD